MTSKLKVNIIADSGDNTLLETNGSGTITTNNIGGENTPAFSAVLTSNQTIGNSTNSLIAFDTVEIDTDSAFTNTSSNYKFTVPSGKAGKYLISAIADMKGTGASSLIACRIQIYKNGSAYNQTQFHFQSNNANEGNPSATILMDLAVSDYIQAYALTATSSGGEIRAEENGAKTTRLCGYRIIGA